MPSAPPPSTPADLALVYPPTCDPTAPYLAVPMLTGFLREHGVRVLPIDANVEAFDELFEPIVLGRLRDRLEARLAELERSAVLDHQGQLEYAALAQARGDAHAVPDGIAFAKSTLRDPTRFFEADPYGAAVATFEAALRVLSATHHPLHVDFSAFRTPFGLTTMREIERASRPENDPFDGFVVNSLVPRLRAAGVRVVGLSVCFPGQLQPAYAFAFKIKRALPELHVTCGGPGITQMLIRLSGQRLERALGPFDSACVFEGEHTLLALVQALFGERNLRDIPNVVLRDRLVGARWLAGHGMEDLRALPAPDFEGLPLARYFAPRLVLPYDPTRGCYWGKCTFCHYGLAEVGTAAYREREIGTAVKHLRALGEKHGTRYFYFSQDSVAPKTLVKLARAMAEEGLGIRWATDLKPEKYLTIERARTLREGGAVACALGVESGSPRVLGLIDKGAPVDVVSDVIDHLADAGIAAEAMCFTDFPTESHDEALQTLDFLRARKDRVAVYIVGEFGLTHGSLVAQDPARFGIRETWELTGDDLGLGIFFAPVAPWKTDDERADIDHRLASLSTGWALRAYPWAGAVSTAHTILYYDRFGSGIFRDLARRAVCGDGEDSRTNLLGILGRSRFEADLRFDPSEAARAQTQEAAIWTELVVEARHVGRDAYESLARASPVLRPKAVRCAFVAGEGFTRLGRAAPRVLGRRPSHTSNATRR